MGYVSGSGRVVTIIFGALLIATSVTANSVRAATFQGLGDLPGPSFNSEANAVSGDGSVVVGRANNAAGLFEAFRWTSADGIQGIGSPFASDAALGISTDGSVIAGQGAAHEYDASRRLARQPVTARDHGGDVEFEFVRQRECQPRRCAVSSGPAA